MQQEACLVLVPVILDPSVGNLWLEAALVIQIIYNIVLKIEKQSWELDICYGMYTMSH